MLFRTSETYTSVATSRGGCLNSIESGTNLRSKTLEDLSNSTPSQALYRCSAVDTESHSTTP